MTYTLTYLRELGRELGLGLWCGVSYPIKGLGAIVTGILAIPASIILLFFAIDARKCFAPSAFDKSTSDVNSLYRLTLFDIVVFEAGQYFKSNATLDETEARENLLGFTDYFLSLHGGLLSETASGALRRLLASENGQALLKQLQKEQSLFLRVCTEVQENAPDLAGTAQTERINALMQRESIKMNPGWRGWIDRWNIARTDPAYPKGTRALRRQISALYHGKIKASRPNWVKVQRKLDSNRQLITELSAAYQESSQIEPGSTDGFDFSLWETKDFSMIFKTKGCDSVVMPFLDMNPRDRKKRFLEKLCSGNPPIVFGHLDMRIQAHLTTWCMTNDVLLSNPAYASGMDYCTSSGTEMSLSIEAPTQANLRDTIETYASVNELSRNLKEAFFKGLLRDEQKYVDEKYWALSHITTNRHNTWMPQLKSISDFLWDFLPALALFAISIIAAAEMLILGPICTVLAIAAAPIVLVCYSFLIMLRPFFGNFQGYVASKQAYLNAKYGPFPTSKALRELSSKERRQVIRSMRYGLKYGVETLFVEWITFAGRHTRFARSPFFWVGTLLLFFVVMPLAVLSYPFWSVLKRVRVEKMCEADLKVEALIPDVIAETIRQNALPLNVGGQASRALCPLDASIDQYVAQNQQRVVLGDEEDDEDTCCICQEPILSIPDLEGERTPEREADMGLGLMDVGANIHSDCWEAYLSMNSPENGMVKPPHMAEPQTSERLVFIAQMQPDQDVMRAFHVAAVCPITGRPFGCFIGNEKAQQALDDGAISENEMVQQTHDEGAAPDNELAQTVPDEDARQKSLRSWGEVEIQAERLYFFPHADLRLQSAIHATAEANNDPDPGHRLGDGEVEVEVGVEAHPGEVALEQDPVQGDVSDGRRFSRLCISGEGLLALKAAFQDRGIKPFAVREKLGDPVCINEKSGVEQLLFRAGQEKDREARIRAERLAAWKQLQTTWVASSRMQDLEGLTAHRAQGGKLFQMTRDWQYDHALMALIRHNFFSGSGLVDDRDASKERIKNALTPEGTAAFSEEGTTSSDRCENFGV